MKSRLQEIKNKAESEIPSVKTEDEISDIKIKYLGRKGALTLLLKDLSTLPPDERKEIGKSANELKNWIEDNLNQKQKEIKGKGVEGLKKGFFDITLPGKQAVIGNIHPLTKVLNDVTEIFIGMGFTVAEGPEIELITITLRHSIFQKTILQGICRIHFISLMMLYCGLTPRLFRSALWKNAHLR